MSATLPEMLGRVIWFCNNNGHGMAKGEDDYTYFLHYSEFLEKQRGGRVMCFEGQTVKFFGDTKNPRGPRAMSVEIVK